VLRFKIERSLLKYSCSVHALNRTLRPLFVFLLLVSVSALGLAQVSGTVTNRTTGQPSVGDTVTLLNLEQNMQQTAEGKTDAQGKYALTVPGGVQYLLRVVHEGAGYFQAVPAGTTHVDMDVYNASAQVAGVATEVLMLRAQTDAGGANLEVTEDFVIQNASKPAMTQYSKEPFNISLPAGAVMESTAAKAPNGMPTAVETHPLAQKGMYTVIFPIRPGETQIEVAYHLPYTGSQQLNLKLVGKTDVLAVGLPKSMTFTPGPGASFNMVNGNASSLTFVTRGLKPDQAVAFDIAGSGQLPRDSAEAGQGADQGAQGGGASDTAPGKGLGVPLDPNGTNEPLLTKYKWWGLGGLGLLLVAAAGVLLRKPAVAPMGAGAPMVAASLPVVASASTGQQQLMQVLKEELFVLETERLQGRVGEAEYAQAKAAIELILRRALARDAASSTPTNTAV
jgi:hypothetical protein